MTTQPRRDTSRDVLGASRSPHQPFHDRIITRHDPWLQFRREEHHKLPRHMRCTGTRHNRFRESSRAIPSGSATTDPSLRGAAVCKTPAEARGCSSPPAPTPERPCVCVCTNTRARRSAPDFWPARGDPAKRHRAPTDPCTPAAQRTSARAAFSKSSNCRKNSPAFSPMVVMISMIFAPKSLRASWTDSCNWISLACGAGYGMGLALRRNSSARAKLPPGCAPCRRRRHRAYQIDESCSRQQGASERNRSVLQQGAYTAAAHGAPWSRLERA